MHTREALGTAPGSSGVVRKGFPLPRPYWGFQDDQGSAPEELEASWGGEPYAQGRTGQNHLGHFVEEEVCVG